MNQGEIIIYQTDETKKLQIEVRIENDTVWLTQSQMVELFGRDRSVITKHINNIFKENELLEKSNVHFLHIALSDKPVKYYSLDVIISVGYRVKSKQGTYFRIWANKIIKNYLLKGYAIQQQFKQIERKIQKQDNTLIEHEQKLELLINKALPPHEGIYFDGQVFDAYVFVANLIKSAKLSIIVLDNYIDESVLLLLSKRAKQVKATIYTNNISNQLSLDIQKHNKQYEKIELKTFTKSHDRFIIIDNTEVFHIGASLKDLGKKWFAFSKINIEAELIMGKLNKNNN